MSESRKPIEMVDSRRSSRVTIHNALASNECLKDAVMSLLSPPAREPVPLPSPNRGPAPNFNRPPSFSQSHSRLPSGAQTPREMVWVDSKEHLSEMATNIRGISNALRNVSISLRVKSVVIITKLSDETLHYKTAELVRWLLNYEQPEPQLVVFVQDVFEHKKGFDIEKITDGDAEKRHRLRFWTTELLERHPDQFDLVVTLGGDGTVLYTSWMFQKVVPPVLSFSLGSLGFMTENKFDDFKEIIHNHLTEGINCALRMRFHCAIMRSHNTLKCKDMNDLKREIQEGGAQGHISTHSLEDQYVILNDVVIDRGPNANITMTELYGNYEYLTSIHADGVVISTPTGSTAYSMSAGGSLVHPDVPATLVTPICPHTLSFRPLVLPDSMILCIGVPYDARSSAYVSFDGKERIELCQGDFLTINASRYPFPKVMPQNYTEGNWVRQLSRILHWNEQKRPKRYDHC